MNKTNEMHCADLGSKCDIVFCSMAADSALESVFSSYLSGTPKQGSIFIDCSTVFPDLTEKLADEAEKAGISYLSSPVFGRPDAALAKKTLVVASGKPAAKKKVGSFLSIHGPVLLPELLHPRFPSLAEATIIRP